ncbi:unnamed protein product [Dracunculus medinensis]|uniref:Bifunctional purine biosynthesis protein ATIC n=1 Tax=Dracunculus medinensis TaxID=318479 RepID=A0A0N4U6Z9_DRAME|nr:unnamed protein product [Dracunculus medinensis]
MMDGRVKTLHPAIFAGILARNCQSDFNELKQNNFPLISVVVCNLYPFKRTVERADCTLHNAIENIDIGGISLLRAAAKNYSRVTVVCDPDDYNVVANQAIPFFSSILFTMIVSSSSRQPNISLRQQLALKVNFR